MLHVLSVGDEVREQLEQTLKGMRKHRTCADDGLVVEMLQTQHEPLLRAMTEIFTDLLNSAAEIPEKWARTKLVILFKKGEYFYRKAK